MSTLLLFLVFLISIPIPTECADLWYDAMDSSATSGLWTLNVDSSYCDFEFEESSCSQDCCALDGAIQNCWETRGHSSEYTTLIRKISTIGYNDITLTFNVDPWAMSGSDGCKIYYAIDNKNDAGDRTLIGNYNSDHHIVDETFDLGFDADQNLGVSIILETYSHSGGDMCYWSKFRLSGTPGTGHPTSNPSKTPSSSPTDPSFDPTPDPSSDPSASPSPDPSSPPSSDPSYDPTWSPSSDPSAKPSHDPSLDPTPAPSFHPTREPTKQTDDPTMGPTTDGPTKGPTDDPSDGPTPGPTPGPSPGPSSGPTKGPTEIQKEQNDGTIEISRDLIYAVVGAVLGIGLTCLGFAVYRRCKKVENDKNMTHLQQERTFKMDGGGLAPTNSNMMIGPTPMGPTPMGISAMNTAPVMNMNMMPMNMLPMRMAMMGAMANAISPINTVGGVINTMNNNMNSNEGLVLSKTGEQDTLCGESTENGTVDQTTDYAVTKGYGADDAPPESNNPDQGILGADEYKTTCVTGGVTKGDNDDYADYLEDDEFVI